MNNIVKVSVVMCTYNGEKYLKEQIDSILNQTYPIYELIIQDDCSIDKTIDIVNEYKRKYPNIKLIRNAIQLGVARNFKTSFYQTKGDYIAISDQDDIWLPDKIKELIEDIGDNYLISSISNYLVKNNVIKEEYDNGFFPLRYVSLQNTLSGHDILFKKELLNLIPAHYWDIYWYDFCLAITAIGSNKMNRSSAVHTLWRRHTEAVTYKPEKQESAIMGYVYSLHSVFNKRNRSMLYLFYKELLPVLTSNEKAFRFAELMMHNNFIRASLFTLKYRREFLTGVSTNSVVGLLRSFFIPFFACRNIQQWNGMSINTMK